MDFSLCGYDTELQPPDICPTLVQTACFTDSPTGRGTWLSSPGALKDWSPEPLSMGPWEEPGPHSPFQFSPFPPGLHSALTSPCQLVRPTPMTHSPKSASASPTPLPAPITQLSINPPLTLPRTLHGFWKSAVRPRISDLILEQLH